MPKKIRRTRISKKTAAKNRNSSFLVRAISFTFISAFFIFSLVLVMYFFVLPSVLGNDNSSKNILLVSDQLDEQNKYIALVHVSENPEENVVIFINGEQMVEVGDDYGEYKLNTIFQLLKIDNQSDQKIKSVFSRLLKITVDEFVILNGIDGKDLAGGALKKTILEKFFADVGGSISNKLKLLKLHYLVEESEILDVDKLEAVEKYYYKLSTIKDELYGNCSVSVVNTTSRSGLAHAVSDIIENTGAQVLQVEGSDATVNKTNIYYPSRKPECKDLVDKLLGIFPNEVEIKMNYELPKTQALRSDILIMLGDDF